VVHNLEKKESTLSQPGLLFHVKIVRRYLFTFLFVSLLIGCLIGWWDSSRVWRSWVAETPYGIFKIQSESSVFGIGSQFMQHDHPWSIYGNADEITGDRIKFVSGFPDLQVGNGLYFVVLPYWELFSILSLIVGTTYFLERSLVRKRLAEFEVP